MSRYQVEQNSYTMQRIEHITWTRSERCEAYASVRVASARNDAKGSFSPDVERVVPNQFDLFLFENGD